MDAIEHFNQLMRAASDERHARTWNPLEEKAQKLIAEGHRIEDLRVVMMRVRGIPTPIDVVPASWIDGATVEPWISPDPLGFNNTYVGIPRA